MSIAKIYRHKRPTYWQYKEDGWLLSDKVREMTHLEHSGYRWLTDHAYHQELPGVITTDDETLRVWARMSCREWSRARAKILACFVLYRDKNGVRWHHHEYIKSLFRTWCEENYNRSIQKYTAVSKGRYKKADSDLKIQVYTDPFHLYTKEVSNELTSAPLHPEPVGRSGAASGGGEDGDGDSIKLGTFLKNSLNIAKGQQ